MLPLALVCSLPAFSQDLFLACHGKSTTDDGRGRDSTPIVAEVRLDSSQSTIRLSGISCWAGRGECTKLAVRVTDTTITAFGDDRTAGTGMMTSVSIDRRSGFMKVSQGRDFKSSKPMPPGPQTHDAELVCQGGTQPRF